MKPAGKPPRTAPPMIAIDGSTVSLSHPTAESVIVDRVGFGDPRGDWSCIENYSRSIWIRLENTGKKGLWLRRWRVAWDLLSAKSSLSSNGFRTDFLTATD